MVLNVYMQANVAISLFSHSATCFLLNRGVEAFYPNLTDINQQDWKILSNFTILK
uniref:Uncharacterized protein n=1 Tax=Anguilla anguilla TaxID=7936 RepID=A0A0E9X649_ANGAN